MKRYFAILFCVVTAFWVTGCTPPPPKKPPMTPIQIENLQSRDYTESKDIVFPSVISVFQDLGYTINEANKDTGIITAESPTKSAHGGGGGMMFELLAGMGKHGAVGSGPSSSYSQTKATAFIETIGHKTHVRLNFVASNETSSFRGQNNRQDKPILDPKVYENAFDKIGSAIFVRKNAN